MTIQYCSREQKGKNKHILDYFAANGINHFQSKCYVGDYVNIANGLIAVERKKDLLEIAPEICGQGHERFRRELIRAQNAGIKLIVLIEEPLSLDTLHTWSSPVRKYGAHKGQPFTQVKGETLKKAMFTMEMKYGVSFQFCDKKDSGRVIVELLSQK